MKTSSKTTFFECTDTKGNFSIHKQVDGASKVLQFLGVKQSNSSLYKSLTAHTHTHTQSESNPECFHMSQRLNVLSQQPVPREHLHPTNHHGDASSTVNHTHIQTPAPVLWLSSAHVCVYSYFSCCRDLNLFR